MRTKALLLTAALSVATVATSMADVFSVNAVGYINITLPPGNTLIANQLNVSNNTLKQVFPSVADGSQVITFSNNVYKVFEFFGGDWYDDQANISSAVIAPGQGFFFNNPGATTNVTLVGEVPQGTNTISLPPGLKLISTVVPQEIFLADTNGFPESDGIQFITFSNNTYKVIENFGGDWYDDQANIVDAKPKVGQGYFINNPGAATNWTRSFSVNN
jgi:hypothetical protein